MAWVPMSVLKPPAHRRLCTLLGDVTRMSGKVVIVGFHQGGMREIPLAYWNWMAFQIYNAHFREVSTILRGMRIGMRLLTSGRLSSRATW